MDPALRVLVCSASAAGSTREIGERIAERIRTDLRDRGAASVEVVCRPAGPDVGLEDVDAVVVGSAVHDMTWLPEATSVLGRAAAAAVPVWVFSVGGLRPRGPLGRAMMALERVRIARSFPAGLVLRDHRLFAGVVGMTGVPLWGQLFWRLVGSSPGDHRDWTLIERWATDVAAEVADLQGTSRGSQHGHLRGQVPAQGSGEQAVPQASSVPA